MVPPARPAGFPRPGRAGWGGSRRDPRQRPLRRRAVPFLAERRLLRRRRHEALAHEGAAVAGRVVAGLVVERAERRVAEPPIERLGAAARGVEPGTVAAA